MANEITEQERIDQVAALIGKHASGSTGPELVSWLRGLVQTRDAAVAAQLEAAAALASARVEAERIAENVSTITSAMQVQAEAVANAERCSRILLTSANELRDNVEVLEDALGFARTAYDQHVGMRWQFWDRGQRAIPQEKVIRTLEALIERIRTTAARARQRAS